MIASFDLMSLCIAALFFFSFYKVKNHKTLVNKKAKVATQTAPVPPKQEP